MLSLSCHFTDIDRECDDVQGQQGTGFKSVERGHTTRKYNKSLGSNRELQGFSLNSSQGGQFTGK